jgi:hypothetical protein
VDSKNGDTNIFVAGMTVETTTTTTTTTTMMLCFHAFNFSSSSSILDSFPTISIFLSFSVHLRHLKKVFKNFFFDLVQVLI